MLLFLHGLQTENRIDKLISTEKYMILGNQSHVQVNHDPKTKKFHTEAHIVAKQSKVDAYLKKKISHVDSRLHKATREP